MKAASNPELFEHYTAGPLALCAGVVNAIRSLISQPSPETPKRKERYTDEEVTALERKMYDKGRSDALEDLKKWLSLEGDDRARYAVERYIPQPSPETRRNMSQDDVDAAVRALGVVQNIFTM